MRRLISRPLALLGSALMFLGVASVAAPAGADAGKYFSVTSPRAYSYLGLDTTVDVVITNENKSQTLGSVQVTMPKAGKDYDLTWTAVSCTVSTGASCDNSGTDWLVTSSTDNVVTTVETPSNTKDALSVGQFITLKYTLSSLSGSAVSSAIPIAPPIMVAAKQSNTFNDAGGGNLFALDPQSPPPALNLMLQPSSYCEGTGNCQLEPTGSDLTSIGVTSTGDHALIGLRPDEDRAGCGRDGSRAVSQVFVATGATAEADDKTVALTWSKDYTRSSKYNSSTWAVCMTAPYDLSLPKEVHNEESDEWTAILPACPAKLQFRATEYPCVEDLGRQGGQQFAVVYVPANPQDPKFF